MIFNSIIILIFLERLGRQWGRNAITYSVGKMPAKYDRKKVKDAIETAVKVSFILLIS